MKRILPILITLVLFLSIVTPSVYAASFKDLDNTTWAKDAVTYLNKNKIVNGYSKDYFGPSDQITRAQAAVMIVNALYKNDKSNSAPKFSDVKQNSYYYEAVAIAAEKGIITGYPDKTFKPDDHITRAAAAVMADRAFKLSKKQANIKFNDIGNLTWARDSINNLASNGIVSGYDNNSFKPDKLISRAEFAVILAAAIDTKTFSNRTMEKNFAAYKLTTIEQEALNLTNKMRTQNGLKPVTIEPRLSRIALYKSLDMDMQNYFDHTSPIYGTPFEMMKDFGVQYRSASENIAYGYQSAEAVVTGWMNSEGHRKNILNPNSTHIGIGYYKATNGTTYWTQMFIGK